MPRTSKPPQWKSYRLHAVVAIVAVAVLAIGSLAIAQDRTITSAVAIRQDTLATGGYTVKKVLESGRQFFAVDFLPADGHGEGKTGPRAAKRQALWSTSIANQLDMPFLRLDGLDSQSCFACHNSAGTYVPPGEMARTQKPGGVGGSADFASVLFSSKKFPDELTHIVRAPPRAFGSGYLQELALEMTDELLGIKQATIDEAAQHPGIPASNDYITKTVNFGKIEVTCPNVACNNPVISESLDGISPDLIVRPLQHKGVAATLRSFTKSALLFHHSMEAVEVVGIDTDCDADGRINEMAVDNVTPANGDPNTVQVQESLGDVAALSAFAGMLRPPTVAAGSTSSDRGREIFAHIGCADCHVPTLTTRPNPQFRILLAEPAKDCPQDCGGYDCASQLGSFAEADAAVHPAVKAATGVSEAVAGKSNTFCTQGFYCIDLTNPGSGLPNEIYPRLPANTDGTVDVSLYSDLKRHDMGPALAQLGDPQADDSGNFNIPNEQWLTSKLWGVRDNGPWLHDGRARTIREAIVMHGGDAATQAQNFINLSDADEQAVLDFLSTLTIPRVALTTHAAPPGPGLCGPAPASTSPVRHRISCLHASGFPGHARPDGHHRT